jgi:hypothetical protein
MTWKRRKRSADPEVPTDPAVFLEGGVPGKYKCVSMLKEQHGEHLYCVSVCALRADHARLFATVGANRASVYRLEDDGGVTLLRAFADDNADEQYFACAWCEASSGELLLALAGHTGVVRVLDVSAAATKKKRRRDGNRERRVVSRFEGTRRERQRRPRAPVRAALASQRVQRFVLPSVERRQRRLRVYFFRRARAQKRRALRGYQADAFVFFFR